MHGLLVVSGPQFRSGLRVPPVENIHLYALMCELLGLQPSSHDGDASTSAAGCDSACRRFSGVLSMSTAPGPVHISLRQERRQRIEMRRDALDLPRPAHGLGQRRGNRHRPADRRFDHVAELRRVRGRQEQRLRCLP